jgi:hypothetical protein
MILSGKCFILNLLDMVYLFFCQRARVLHWICMTLGLYKHGVAIIASEQR